MCINVVVRPTCQNLPTSHHLTTVVTLLLNKFLHAIIHRLHSALRSVLKIPLLRGHNLPEEFLHPKVSLLEIFQRLLGRVLPHLLHHEVVVFQVRVEVHAEVEVLAEEEEVVKMILIQ